MRHRVYHSHVRTLQILTLSLSIPPIRLHVSHRDTSGVFSISDAPDRITWSCHCPSCLRLKVPIRSLSSVSHFPYRMEIMVILYHLEFMWYKALSYHFSCHIPIAPIKCRSLFSLKIQSRRCIGTLPLSSLNHPVQGISGHWYY